MILGRWLLLSLLTFLLFTARGHVGAQQAPSLAVDPTTQAVRREDGPFDVRVTVDDVTTDPGLGGYTLVMTYDPTLLHALTITDSGFVTSTGNAVVCPASGIDNDVGRLAYLCFTIPIFAEPGPRTSEPQVLVTIRFEPIAEGVTTLDISEATITDPQGNGLGASTRNGQVTVQRGSLGPTSTGPTPVAETERSSPADAEAGDTSLPVSGTGPREWSGNLAQYIALSLTALGAVLFLGALLMRNQRKGEEKASS